MPDKVQLPEKVQHQVTSGPVRFSIFKHSDGGWRFVYRDAENRRRYVTRKSLKETRRLAKLKAGEIRRGSAQLEALSPEKVRLVRRILDMAPTEKKLTEFATWLEERAEKPATLEEVAVKMLTAKSGKSARHLQGLKYGLKKLVAKFGTRRIETVKAEELDGWLAGLDLADKSKKGIRGTVSAVFRYGRDHGHLPENRRTAAEKMEKVEVEREAPEIFTPAQLRKLLEAVKDEFRGWLVLAGFCGIRAAEIMRLDWANVKWGEGHVEIPEKATKTKRRRVVDLPPPATLWIPEKPRRGPVTRLDPAKAYAREVSETARLGELIGGWKQNALRHSWCSYRTALVGAAMAANEAGNSEATIRRDYEKAATKAAAQRWFTVSPKK